MNQHDLVTIASLNLHAGLSRRGEPYDIAAACYQLKADVITLQETWRPDGQPDPIADIAAGLGAQLRHVGLAASSLSGLHVGPGTSPGTWGMAVLTVLPVLSYEVIPLGAAPADRISRSAQVVTLGTPGGGRLRVASTHLTHRFTSPVQLRRLARRLAAGSDPTVIIGDLNMPRAATLAASGYRPVIRGRTYPADRPLIQLDHLLTGPGVAAADGEVLDPVGSDHLAIRAQIGPV